MKRFASILLSLALCLPLFAGTVHSPATTQPNSHRHATTVQADNGNPDVKVWVNTASGVYHCPGTRWYGATKQGEYMTQAEAQKKGYRPAYGRLCR